MRVSITTRLAVASPLRRMVSLLAPALLGVALLGSCAEVGRAFPDASVAGEPAADAAQAGDSGDTGVSLDGSVDVPVRGQDTSAVDLDGAGGADASLDDASAVDASLDTGGPAPDGAAPDEGLVVDGETPHGPCTPCEVDADCPDSVPCESLGAAGSFCGLGCEAGICTEAAEGRTTTCFLENTRGHCEGGRVCVAGALTACTALTPTPEVCNGQDDDCDGDTDEGAPDLDADGLKDCVDPDDDGDGVPDLADNCPLIKNPGQADLDQDEVGDACDNDLDGDGVANLADCAPDDPEVSEASAEVCNAKDDDCDGETDEADALGCAFFYPDQDGDGFGASGLGACLCGPSGIYTTGDSGDCDDTSKLANPSGTEVCDGLDNNCDGVTDEEGAQGCGDWFFDGDSDGYFVPGADVKCLCFGNQINQFTGNVPGDCDDEDGSVFPGAIERCDGVDQSCEGDIDEGCDDDQDGYCDADLVYLVTGGLTCSLGSGDCDDTDPAVHPGAIEICDGKDSNCNVTDNKAEGTVAACGEACEPCPEPPAGAAYECAGIGPGSAGCQLTCPTGSFCESCDCDGSQVFDYGTAVVDGKVVYDASYDSFRLGYFKQGAFRLKAIGATGVQGNDVVAVGSVDKWTDWGLATRDSAGSGVRFAFAWTSYPDSSIRVGLASAEGTALASYVVAADLPGAKNRRNVQIGWHTGSQTFLLVWDETTELGEDIRGVLLDKTGAPLSSPFQVVGGGGDQFGPSLGARSGGLGHVLSYGTHVGGATTPGLRFMDHSGGQALNYGLSPMGKASTSPKLWYSPAVDAGLVQWLGADNSYHLRLVGEGGAIGSEVALGAPLGAAFGAPKDQAMRLVYVSAGLVRVRSVALADGTLSAGTSTLSLTTPTQKIVGGVRHPLDYGLVLWNVNGALRGRLVPPSL